MASLARREGDGTLSLPERVSGVQPLTGARGRPVEERATTHSKCETARVDPGDLGADRVKASGG